MLMGNMKLNWGHLALKPQAAPAGLAGATFLCTEGLVQPALQSTQCRGQRSAWASATVPRDAGER